MSTGMEDTSLQTFPETRRLSERVQHYHHYSRVGYTWITHYCPLEKQTTMPWNLAMSTRLNAR